MMDTYLRDLWDELVEAKKAFLVSITDARLREVVGYALRGPEDGQSWGSQSRGLILMLTSGLRFGPQEALPLEVFHNASLVVDDLIDRSATRRNGPALWTVFGVEEAYITSHWMAAAATRMVEKSRLPSDAVRDLMEDVQAMASAEVSSKHVCSQTSEAYLQYAHAKTGLLYRRAALLGLGCRSHEWADLIGRIGIIHQIRDDVADRGVDAISESVFGRRNWCLLSNTERRKIGDWLCRVRDDEWPSFVSSIGEGVEGRALATLLMDVAQFTQSRDPTMCAAGAGA